MSEEETRDTTQAEGVADAPDGSPLIYTYYHGTEQVEKLEDRLLNDFTYHAPHGDQADRYVVLRREALKLAQRIIYYTPPSREQSLALTNLEQAIFWANAAIARNEEDPSLRKP